MTRSALLNPNANWHGVEWPVTGETAYQASKGPTQEAFAWLARPDSTAALTSVDVVLGPVVGYPAYTVEMIPLQCLVPANKTALTAVPTATIVDEGWVPNTGTEVAAVDDAVGAPDDLTTYITCNTAGAAITFACSPASLTGKRVAYLEVRYRARLSIYGTGYSGSIRPLLKFNETAGQEEFFGPAVPLTDQFADFVSSRWYVNPETNRQWSPTDIAAFAAATAAADQWSFGVELVSLSVPVSMYAYVTQAYLRVAYADDNVVARVDWEQPPSGSNTVAMTPTLGPQFRDHNEVGNVSTSSLTITTPGAAKYGDRMLAIVAIGNSSFSGVPAGWTEETSEVSAGAWTVKTYSKVFGLTAGVQVTEPASYTWSFAGNVKNVGAIYMASGSDVAAVVALDQANASSASVAAASITTTKPGALLVFLAATNATATFTPPAGMTERVDASTTGLSITVADVPLGAAGATGAKTATASAAATSCGVLIALNPAVYAVVAHPVVADPSNYVVVPMLTPEVNDDWEACTVAYTDGLASAAETRLGGSAALLLNRATDQGQPYYDFQTQTVLTGAGSQSAVYSAADATQRLRPDASVTVRPVKFVAWAPDGLPTADLVVRLEDAAGTLLTSVTVPAADLATSPTQMVRNLAAGQAVTSGTTYRVTFRSATTAARPVRVGAVVALGSAPWSGDGVNQGGQTDYASGESGTWTNTASDLIVAIGVGPTAVTGVTAAADNGAAAVTVSWAASGDSALSFYTVKRRRAGATSWRTLDAGEALTVLTFTDRTCPLGVPVEYAVTQTRTDGAESVEALA